MTMVVVARNELGGTISLDTETGRHWLCSAPVEVNLDDVLASQKEASDATTFEDAGVPVTAELRELMQKLAYVRLV